MAYLHKNEIERRERAAANHAFRQKKIKTLSEEQHNLISRICTARHHIHSNTMKYYSADNCPHYFEWLGGEGAIEISEAKLPPLKLPYWPEDLPFSEDRYLGVIEDTDEAEEEHKEKFIEMMEEIEKAIWHYLKEIDMKFGTEYTPTGALRIF